MNVTKNALFHAHRFVSDVVREGDTVVDATMGNGHDTCFLAKLAGASGRVVAFDIQAQALEKTRERLEEAGLLERVQLVCDGHQHMEKYVQAPVRCVMFNLGYLPGGDHGIATMAETTIPAIEAALRLTGEDGLVAVMVYFGGDSGFEEHDALMPWVKGVDCRTVNVMRIDYPNGMNCPPFLLLFQNHQARKKK